MYRKAMETAAGGDATVVVSLLKAAAALGHSRSAACIADFQLSPYGGERGDRRKATTTMIRLWREHNDPMAVLVLALNKADCTGAGAKEFPDEAACQRALAALTADCESWDLFGQYGTACCFIHGIGCSADPSRGCQSMLLLARRGYLPAMSDTGYCYQFGKGVAKDFAESVKWYRLAADQGYAVAQFNLGCSYEHGEGVAKDLTEAAKWYRLAADQGYAGAQCSLGTCYHSGNGVARDFAEAVKWYRLAADQGNAAAQYGLGLCYRDGLGVAKDLGEAVKWFRLAADQGDTEAQSALSKMGK
jgi:TPR repeat protein